MFLLLIIVSITWLAVFAFNFFLLLLFLLISILAFYFQICRLMSAFSAFIYYHIHPFSSLTFFFLYMYFPVSSQSIELYPQLSWHVNHLSDNFHICVLFFVIHCYFSLLIIFIFYPSNPFFFDDLYIHPLFCLSTFISPFWVLSHFHVYPFLYLPHIHYTSIINLSLTSPHFLCSLFPIFHPQFLPLNSSHLSIITFTPILSHLSILISTPFLFSIFPFFHLFNFFCTALFSHLNNNWPGITAKEMCKVEEFYIHILIIIK